MHYTKFSYLYPPRPETPVPAAMLAQLEKLGWWGQPKFNGSNCVLYVPPRSKDGARVTLQRGRHGDQPLKIWQPGACWDAFTARLPRGWHVLSAELLHRKGNYTDTVVLHDVLVTAGRSLVGMAYRDRYRRLEALCGLPIAPVGPSATHAEVIPHVWLALVYQERLRERWEALKGAPAIEGLVLKNPNAGLRPCLRADANSAWLAKCRFVSANASF